MNPMPQVKSFILSEFSENSINLQKILKLPGSLAKQNSNLKPVAGSKQKHMAIPSIVGSTLSLEYPLFQGLLIKEQLN